MDFPQFFRTGLQNLRIASDRWRGLAVLCKTPETQQSYRGIHEDNVLGVTGSGFTNRMVAAMVMPPHMKVASGAFVTGPGTVVLPAQPGIRYLLHTYQFSYAVTAIGTTASVYVSVVINGATFNALVHYPVALTAAGYHGSGVWDVVTDVNTAVTALAGTQDPASGNFVVYYAEIGAS